MIVHYFDVNWQLKQGIPAAKEMILFSIRSGLACYMQSWLFIGRKIMYMCGVESIKIPIFKFGMPSEKQIRAGGRGCVGCAAAHPLFCKILK